MLNVIFILSTLLDIHRDTPEQTDDPEDVMMWISFELWRHQLNGQPITYVGSPCAFWGLNAREPPCQSPGRDQIVARQAHCDRHKNAYPLSLASCTDDSWPLPFLHIGVEGPPDTRGSLVGASISTSQIAPRRFYSTIV